jgi:hypothetical protein
MDDSDLQFRIRVLSPFHLRRQKLGSRAKLPLFGIQCANGEERERRLYGEERQHDYIFINTLGALALESYQ